MMAPESTVDAKAAYVLVDAGVIAKMGSSKIDGQKSDDDGIDTASKYSIPLTSSSPIAKTRGKPRATDDNTVELTTLEQWYEFYAERYPSRGYLERQQQLRQVEQEKVRQNEMMQRETRKQQGGWLSRLLFGRGGGADDKEAGSTKQENDNDGHEEVIDDNSDDDNQPIYYKHDDGMCGTSSSLDKDAITKEALAFHRFHLVSERRALCTNDSSGRNNQWHVALPIRNTVGMDADENEERSTFSIVGYGKIAEFPPLPPSSSSGHEQLLQSEAKVTLTSDRAALCQFVNDRNHDSLSDLRHTRAALIGPDCLAVSWGRGDGFIVIYRRAQQQGGAKNLGNKKEQNLEVGWMAVAVIAPTDAVVNEGVKSLTPSPYADREQREIASLFESGPLRVTDLMPMVVKNDNNNDRDHSISAILAISRLGGYIEFVPIPNQIWSRYARPPTPPLNQLPNLTGMVKVTAISTGHHHVDIMALDACRTSIDSDSEEPAANIILASCGSSAGTETTDHRQEIVTLWGITTTHLEPQRDDRDDNGPMSFSVCVNEINSIVIGQLGADSTIFCDDLTGDRWAEDADAIGENKLQKRMTVSCSITAKVPITTLRFSPKKFGDVHLAALDYNGGVTVIDTTRSSIIFDRELLLSTATRKSCEVKLTSQIEWWCPPQSHATHLAFFSITKRKHRKAKTAIMKSTIHLYNVELGDGISEKNTLVQVRSQVPSTVALKGGTVLLPVSHHSLHETLLFVQFSNTQKEINLTLGGVRTIIDPSQMISLLLERSDPEKALSIARKFGGAEHFGGKVMNECRMKLWEDQMNVEALRLVSDDKYVIEEAVKLIGIESHSDTLDGVHLDTLLEVYREGLRRCERELSTEQGADKEWLRANALQLRKTILSFGTFKVLLKHFMKGSVPEEGHKDDYSRRFLNFLRATVFEIAECAATNCDVGALTIIFARHRLSLRERMIILDKIPVHLDLTTFQHLLPCHDDVDGIQGGFLCIKRPQVFMTTVEFFRYVADAQLQGLEQIADVFTDDFDRENVLESFEISVDKSKPVSKDDVAAWYLKRAMNLSKETGQINLLSSACEMGLIRLGLASLNCDGECKGLDVSLHTLSEVSGKLYYLFVASQLLQHISEDKLRWSLPSHDSPAQILSSASTLFRSLPQICSMGIVDIVFYMCASGDIFSRSTFDEYVKSFIASDQYLKPDFGSGSVSGATNADVLSDEIGKDVIKMCLRKITSVRDENVECKKQKIMSRDALLASSHRLENVLASCIYFASLGHNAEQSAIRIIRDENDLVDFVEQVFQSIMIVVSDDWDLITDSLLQTIWTLFELLPLNGFLSDDIEENPEEEIESRSGIIGILYFKLVTLELVRKWRINDSLPRTLTAFFHSQINRVDVAALSDCNKIISPAGYDVVAFVCGSFSVQVTRGCDEDLLFDFISDIEEFDRRFFSGTVQSSGSLGRFIVPVLLKLQAFDALRGVLKLQPTWFDEDYICSVIQSFVVDRMSTNLPVYEREAATVGLACMKSIGPLFPRLCNVFEYQHRLFDAKNFTSDTMNVSNDVIGKVFDAGNSNLVIIECLIQECPRSLLIGCEFWDDFGSSKNACVDAMQYFALQIESAMSGNPVSESALVLPPMPGGLVMQLSNILGINTPIDTLLVKKLMLMGALRKGLVHAAVAICYSMLADAAFADEYTDTYKSELLSCIDAILLDRALINSFVKKDLCIQSLKVFSMTRSASVDTILKTFYDIEYESLMKQEQVLPEGGYRDVHEFNFLKRVAKQAKDLTTTNDENISSLAGKNNFFTDSDLSYLLREIKESTSTDLLSLLSSFREGALPNTSDLDVICRTLLSWINSEALVGNKSTKGSALTGYNIVVMIELVFCCLRELDNDTAGAIINYYVEAFESTLQQGFVATNTQIQPDLAIVERLNGRGYGWNASRRAAIMTNNQGYSEALSWAVTHFQDEDFDSPLYFLQDDECEPQRIERSVVEDINKLLLAMQASLRRPSTKHEQSTITGAKPNFDGDSNGALITGTQSTNAPIPSSTTKGGNGDLNGILADDKASSPPPTLPTSLDMTKNVKLEKPLIATEDGDSNSISLSQQDITAVKTAPNAAAAIISSSAVKGGYLNRNKKSQAPPPPPPPPPPLPLVSQEKESTLLSSPSQEKTVSSVEGSLGSRSSMKKQVTRGGTALGTHKLSLDERKKLALEGKRLLDLARARNKRVVAPPSTITTTSTLSKP